MSPITSEYLSRILDEDRKARERTAVREWINRNIQHGLRDRIEGVPYRVCTDRDCCGRAPSEHWQECEIPMTPEDSVILELCKKYDLPIPFKTNGDKRVVEYNRGDSRAWQERSM